MRDALQFWPWRPCFPTDWISSKFHFAKATNLGCLCLESAFDCFRRFERYPNSSSAMIYYALFLSRFSKRLETAKNFYERALALDPSNLFALLAIAEFTYVILED